MSGERGRPGERGAKGDHGQHGDTGDTGVTGDRGQRGQLGQTGATGERGAHGDTGQAGNVGRPGPRGPANWRAYVAMGVAVFVAGYVFLRQDDQDKVEIARTSLSNCQQIEVVKDEIRGTVEDSVARLDTLDYYRTRPQEKAQAIRDAKASVARFAELDCYALPAVRDAGLKPPRGK